MSLLKRLHNLFSPMHNYALVDQQGICRALRQSTQPPLGSAWIEVAEHNLSWLSRPLPENARLNAAPAPQSQPPKIAA